MKFIVKNMILDAESAKEKLGEISYKIEADKKKKKLIITGNYFKWIFSFKQIQNDTIIKCFGSKWAHVARALFIPFYWIVGIIKGLKEKDEVFDIIKSKLTSGTLNEKI